MWKRLNERINNVFAVLVRLVVVHLLRLQETVMKADIRKLTLLKLACVVWVNVLKVHDVRAKARVTSIMRIVKFAFSDGRSHGP